MRRWTTWMAALGLAACAARGETVLERVLKPYESIQSLSGEIRRDTPLPDGQTLRMLSRVYYQRPDKLHVENFSPVKRRIVSDGTVFRSYTEGAPKGFSRPVADLNEEMLRNLRMVPGSAANMLEVLKGSAEVPLEPTAEYPVRAGYDNGKSFAILNLDDQGRLARFEIYGSAARTDLLTRTDFSAFQEVAAGVWIAGLQQSQITVQGMERTETTRVDNLAANGEIPAALFRAEAFFPDVEFVDSFEKIGP
ncbi:MAG: outer membrane lipoprotein carrier protein LolA [Kiritimatiellia bacterium]